MARDRPSPYVVWVAKRRGGELSTVPRQALALRGVGSDFLSWRKANDTDFLFITPKNVSNALRTTKKGS